MHPNRSSSREELDVGENNYKKSHPSGGFLVKSVLPAFMHTGRVPPHLRPQNRVPQTTFQASRAGAVQSGKRALTGSFPRVNG